MLAATNADHSLHPASLTKITMLYMTLDALKRGDISLKQLLGQGPAACRQRTTGV